MNNRNKPPHGNTYTTPQEQSNPEKSTIRNKKACQPPRVYTINNTGIRVTPQVHENTGNPPVTKASLSSKYKTSKEYHQEQIQSHSNMYNPIKSHTTPLYHIQPYSITYNFTESHTILQNHTQPH
jgi:hypothetical protein